MITSVLRGALVWAGTAALTAVSARSAAGGVTLDARLDVVLVDLATVALALCAGWAWLVTSAVLAQALRAGAHPGPRRPVRGVPTWAARAVLVACGLAVLTTAPGQGADGSHGPAPAAPPSLDGLPLPDRATGPARPPASATRPVVVGPGDTLWAIARSRIDPAADDAAVARATAELYAANRDVVGPDPDLIHPGLHLRAPERRPDH
ncbi:LysM peptidoglycan-binding domain-containing protein [Nocardioides dongxiaopingii]|uniref:LysM peptidoglycan-binding domain-containing protein n=1 Tax=Nocardioides sp. S-1144 TaxID=2582905 RepID=UPI0011633669|nr:LysM domain-containing protein [Nocardioides sp. S-1144]QDH10803.1 LysM peptidoglycan-binding domain-containing protein [Nocardioides sp. S-1144]